jgi:Family of unknown function (DUF5678)
VITLDVETNVPESREVVVKLPPEVPVGRAVLEVRVKEPPVEIPTFTVNLNPDVIPKAFPPRPTHPKLAREQDAFEQMLPELVRQYAVRYVAVHDGRVVGVGTSEVGVLTQARQAVPGEMVLVRLVTDQPQPITRVPHFREVRRAAE